MKKIYLALVCIVSIAMVTACGGGGSKSPAPTTDNEKVDEVVEKAFSDMTGMEKFASVLKNAYQLEVQDVAPAFEFAETNEEGKFYFYGSDREDKVVTANFIKKDASEISKEEYKAYVQKVYDLMKGKSQDGKLVRGFDGGAETTDEALEEKTFDNLFENEFWPQEFCYRMGDVFYACSMSLEEPKGKLPCRIKFENRRGLQKSLGDTMDEAEKALDDAEVQKVLKEKL